MIYDAESLLDAFHNDSVNIDKRLRGKVIQITGNITNGAAVKHSSPVSDVSYIRFGDFDKMQIICYFDGSEVYDLNIGDRTTVVGKYRHYEKSSYGDTIEIGHCLIKNEFEHASKEGIYGEN